MRQALSTGGPEAAEAGARRPGRPVRAHAGQRRTHPPRPPARRRAPTRCWPHWRRDSGVGVVATTAAHFAEPSRGRLAMAMGAIRARNSMDEAAGWLAPLGGSHLRSGEEMARLFARRPEAVTAAAELGEQCAFGLALIAPKLPPFDVPDGTHRGQLAAPADHGRRPRPVRPARAGSAGLRADRARAESHRPAELSRLLPGRPRHHPVLPRQRHSVPGPGVGGQLRGLLRPRRHRTSTRWPTSCCSSGSCHRRATARPTSTSTSNPTCARRRSSTSTSATAATTPPRSPTSSPTAAEVAVRDMARALGFSQGQQDAWSKQINQLERSGRLAGRRGHPRRR